MCCHSFSRHISEPKEDWFRAMLSTIFTIHSEAPARFELSLDSLQMLIFIREDILVFMTGQEEIENMARQIRTIAKEYQDRPRLEVGNSNSWVPPKSLLPNFEYLCNRWSHCMPPRLLSHNSKSSGPLPMAVERWSEATNIAFSYARYQYQRWW